MADLIPTGARALDLGCGNGGYWTICAPRKRWKAGDRGEAGRACWPACVAASACARATCKEGLADYPTTKNFDVVILSQTLQFLNDPAQSWARCCASAVWRLSASPTGATGAAALQLLVGGEFPPRLSPAWHDAPRRQPFSAADFRDFCRARGITIRRTAYLSGIEVSNAGAQFAGSDGDISPSAAIQKGRSEIPAGLS